MIEKREVFKHRIDKLETKVHNMTTGLITEYFAPGRPDCLKGILHFCFYMYVSDFNSCIYQTYSGYTPCVLQVSVFKSWLPYRQSRKWSSNHCANSLRTQTYFRSSLFSTWKVPFREERVTSAFAGYRTNPNVYISKESVLCRFIKVSTKRQLSRCSFF